MNYVKSKQRVADHGEVFTPAWMVAAMLDLVMEETERIDSRFLEPTCGNGNFIVQIVGRKLPYLQHAFWFLPNVAACHAMANLLAERHNTFWHAYRMSVAAVTAEIAPPAKLAPMVSQVSDRRAWGSPLP